MFKQQNTCGKKKKKIKVFWPYEVQSICTCTRILLALQKQNTIDTSDVSSIVLGKLFQASVTVELDDFHPLPLHVLTHEAEALVFKVTLELGIDLRIDHNRRVSETVSTLSSVRSRF